MASLQRNSVPAGLAGTPTNAGEGNINKIVAPLGYSTSHHLSTICQTGGRTTPASRLGFNTNRYAAVHHVIPTTVTDPSMFLGYCDFDFEWYCSIPNLLHLNV